MARILEQTKTTSTEGNVCLVEPRIFDDLCNILRQTQK